MEVKKALILFSVMLAFASAAAIGVMLPENYPTPEPIAPQQTVPAAPQAPVPIAPQPGHPGGIYTQVAATIYGPLKIEDVQVGDFDGSTIHIAPDKLSAMVQGFADTRDDVEVKFKIKDLRDNNGLIYITVSTQPGVEVGLSSSANATIKHISPGVYVVSFNKGENREFWVTVTIYGQPIASGDRTVTLTFTAQ